MKILYFAPIYYDDMKQRPQQLADCLSKNHEVYYIEPTISLMRWMLKKGKTFRGCREKINQSLTVIRLNGAFVCHKSLEIFDVFGLNNLSEMAQLRGLIKRCDIIWVGYSGWYTLVRHIKGKPVVFDKMDEEDLLAASFLQRKILCRNKKKMQILASAVVVTCEKFYREMVKIRGNVSLVRNAVSDSFYADDAEIDFDVPNGIKRIGYIGTIGEWFDTSVIYRLLELFPKCEITLVGRNYLPEIKNERVTYSGILPNRELPHMIKTFDLCLYNFKISPLLDTINPVKIYEYLSMNKPVLAVKSEETAKLGRYVMLYGSADELETVLHRGLKRPFASQAELEQFILANSWSERAAGIEKILREEVEKVR